MTSGGAIITVKLKANQNQTYTFCKSLIYFTMAESLGGVESLICHPATMTHSSLSTETKIKLGIDESMVRLSVGCEDLLDLKKDLNHQLSQLL